MEGCATLQIAATRRTVNLVFFFGIILFFSFASLLATNAAFIVTDTIYNGVTIGNIPVGGLSIPEAKNVLLTSYNNRVATSSITVTYQNQTRTITPQEIDLSIDADALATQAYTIGRSGNIIKILQERYLAVNGGYSIPFAKNYNSDKLYTLLAKMATVIDRSPQNARLYDHDNLLQVVPEVWGQEVDIKASVANLTTVLDTAILFTSELTVKELPPSILSSDLATIDSLLATYSTQFDPNNKNRYQNVAIAAKKINNTLVHPGEVFSFNQAVGLRLPEFGYKEAPVLVDGKLLLDWGGGVCQVSTTLYNATLLADMSIEERTSHFQPPSYVPLGQDAAVADNLLDFKFKNVSSHNIYITSEVFNDQLTVSIYGKKIPNLPEIHIETVPKTIGYRTIIKQDSSLPVGREIVEAEGRTGFEVTTSRVKLTNGQEISREVLSADEFRAEDRVIRIGTNPQRSK